MNLCVPRCILFHPALNTSLRIGKYREIDFTSLKRCSTCWTRNVKLHANFLQTSGNIPRMSLSKNPDKPPCFTGNHWLEDYLICLTWREEQFSHILMKAWKTTGSWSWSETYHVTLLWYYPINCSVCGMYSKCWGMENDWITVIDTLMYNFTYTGHCWVVITVHHVHRVYFM